MTTQPDDLTQLDHAHLWHPFTPMRQWRMRKPFIVERAEGFELISVDGDRLIDGVSSLWCNVHGHRARAIDDAIGDQLGRVAHTTLLGLSSPPAITLASQLARLANAVEPATPTAPLSKVFFSDAGATATEAALKMAIGARFHRSQRTRATILTLAGGYHGDTVGAMSAGFSRALHAPFETITFQCAKVAAPDPRRVDESRASDAREWPSWDDARCAQARDDALRELDAALRDLGDRAAALMLEPVMQGAAGMIAQPAGYLAALAERVRDAGAWLIADEVATGFARVGSLLACDSERVRPDILCLGKGLSGGYLPLAATLATDEIASAFEGEPHQRRTLYHGHTFSGNSLACAAALASIDLLERNRVVEHSRTLSQRIRQRLREGLFEHPSVGDVRNRGVMTGVELVAARQPWTQLPASVAASPRVCDEARARGLFVRPLGDVVVFNPAPAMDLATLDRALDILIESIHATDFTRDAPEALAATPAGANPALAQTPNT